VTCPRLDETDRAAKNRSLSQRAPPRRLRALLFCSGPGKILAIPARTARAPAPLAAATRGPPTVIALEPGLAPEGLTATLGIRPPSGGRDSEGSDPSLQRGDSAARPPEFAPRRSRPKLARPRLDPLARRRDWRPIFPTTSDFVGRATRAAEPSTEYAALPPAGVRAG